MITEIVKAIQEANEANKANSKNSEQIRKPKYITIDRPQVMPDFDPVEKLFEGKNRAMSKSKKLKLAGQIKSLAKSYGYLASRQPDKTTIMPIPTNSKKLNAIFGNASQVSESLTILERAGLIELEDSNYGFNHKNPEDNKARTFSYNTLVEDYLLDKFKDIEPYYCKPPKLSEIGNLIEYYRAYSPKIGQNAIPKKGSERQITAAIKHLIEEQYPILKAIEADINELNEFYKDKPEFIMRASPSIKITDHTVSKIGYRPTSDFCNSINDLEHSELKTPENSNMVRSKILKKYGISPHKYDVKASVPRVTRSIHTGKWNTLDDINDIYTEIWNECKNIIQTKLATNPNDILKKFNKTIHNDQRPAIKSLFMRGYFANSKEYMAAKIGNILGYSSEIQICCDIFCDAIKSIIGESFKSEIFIYEGAIMAKVALKLCKKGNFCVTVYDAFYTQKPVDLEEMEALFQEAFDELSPYFKSEKSQLELEYCPVCGCVDSKNKSIEGCSECKPFLNSKNKTQSTYNNISLCMKLCDLDYGIIFNPNFDNFEGFLVKLPLKYSKLE